jgi:hypothetical protein
MVYYVLKQVVTADTGDEIQQKDDPNKNYRNVD